ncbi:MAG: hypothetical protein ABH860_00545, partial [bacterium]
MSITVTQQVSRNIGFRGRSLPIKITNLSEGGNIIKSLGRIGVSKDIAGIRASDIFTDRRLDLKVPLLAEKDVQVSISTPRGHEVEIEKLGGMTPEQIDKLLSKVDEALLAIPRIPEALIPKMIDVPTQTFRIMQSPVTVGLFKLFMADTGYEITGHTAGNLKAQLGGAPESVLTYLNLEDGRALAQWLNKVTGKSSRVPTERE